MQRRFPAIAVLVFPVPVQGEGAADKIAAAIRQDLAAREWLAYYVQRFPTVELNASFYRLSPEDRDDLCSEVFLNVIKDDFAILRRFRGQSSLATYLTVVTRRIVVKRMMQKRLSAPIRDHASASSAQDVADYLEVRPERTEELAHLVRRIEDIAAARAPTGG